MNPPCTRTCLEMAIGATCPDCGHNSVLHPGPADVACCTHCELENLTAELKRRLANDRRQAADNTHP